MAKKTRTQLKDQSKIIRDETANNGNTTDRIANMIDALTDSNLNYEDKATEAEALAGQNEEKFIVPKTLQAKLDALELDPDQITETSSKRFLHSSDIKALAVATAAAQTSYASSPGVYFPELHRVPFSNAVGLAIASGGGVIATTSGTEGSGVLYLRELLRQNEPFRFEFLIEINEKTGNDGGDSSGNMMSIAIRSQDNAYYQGIEMKTNGFKFTGDSGGSNHFNGNGWDSIPAGSKYWFVVASAGAEQHGVWAGIIPYGDNLTSINYGKDNDAQPIGQNARVWKTAGGPNVWQNIDRIEFKTKSSANKLLGMYFRNSLDGPSDGQLQPPLMLRANILGDTTAWIAVPGRQGYEPVDAVCMFHPNQGEAWALTQKDGTSTRSANLCKFLNQGYIMFGILGSSADTGVGGPTGSNWCSPVGMVYREEHINWVRAMFTLIRDIYGIGNSMGGGNVCAYAAQHPGAIKKLGLISPVLSLMDCYANRGFENTMNGAYCDLYVALQDAADQNPATSPTYWKRIAKLGNAPERKYYKTPYVWKYWYGGTYGTTFQTNDIVAVPNSLSADFFNPYDPTTNGAFFETTPVMVVQGSADSLIPTSQTALFKASVEDGGGTVQVITVPGEGHLGEGLYTHVQDIINFFKA